MIFYGNVFLFINLPPITCIIFILVHLTLQQKLLPIIPGDYPHMSDKGVNLPDCGLRYIPRPHKLYFNDKCFKNKNETIDESIYWEIELIRDEPEKKKRILNSQDAEYAEAPWTVILTNQFLRFIPLKDCSGVLITYEWVLTAAHCYMDLSIASVKITAGTNERAGIYNRRVHQHQWYRHPNWTGNANVNDGHIYDIALIKLDNKFPKVTDGMQYIINPICLPRRDRIPRWDEELATFFGHGLIRNEANWILKQELPNNLQKADMYIQGIYSSCVKEAICNFKLTDSNTSATCVGDSGGGLVQYTDSSRSRAVLLGILSSGSHLRNTLDCDNDITADVFVMIAKRIDWILDTIRRN